MIGDIAMDLKRASLGKGTVSKVFLNEAFDKIRKLNIKLPRYIQKILKKIKSVNNKEDLLMYSILLQNYATKNHGK